MITMTITPEKIILLLGAIQLRRSHTMTTATLTHLVIALRALSVFLSLNVNDHDAMTVLIIVMTTALKQGDYFLPSFSRPPSPPTSSLLPTPSPPSHVLHSLPAPAYSCILRKFDPLNNNYSCKAEGLGSAQLG